MHIGLTYDLRDDYLAAGYSKLETAELDAVDTIDGIDLALRELGHTTERIGSAAALVDQLAGGNRWDLVFNICEGLHGRGRESTVPSLLDVYGVAYTFGDACTMAVCLDKSIAKAVVRDAGLATPRSRLVESLDDLAHLDLQYPLFAKPVAEGTGKGIEADSYLSTRAEVRDTCARLLREHRQGVLVEEFLPGREFTVGIVGTGAVARVVGTMEIFLMSEAEPHAYSYSNKANYEEVVRYDYPTASDPQVAAAEQLALAAWRALGGRDGGRIDLRCDAQGQPQFIEANPLAGLNPIHSDLPLIARARGMSFGQLIAEIIDSASVRVGQARPLLLGAG